MDGWKSVVVLLAGGLGSMIVMYFTRIPYFGGLIFLSEALYVLYFLVSGKDAYFKGQKQTKKDLIGFIIIDIIGFTLIVILVQLKVISF
ncbi:hypothetical protein [Treponema pedis]|uniref:hypothetical protein n=1 Tax=Treponema pedis TaxID=409322 RepID=UPI0003FFE5CE|nr:hypothetical protein [Treponema pedis]